jgi:hypothetical protein
MAIPMLSLEGLNWNERPNGNSGGQNVDGGRETGIADRPLGVS